MDTKIGSPEIEEAQWYLARISEKQGKLDDAKRQYTLFLKDFPSSRHLDEVQKRLAALSSPQPASSGEQAKEAATPDPSTPPFKRKETGSRFGKLTGSLTSEYLYEDALTPSPSKVTQNRLGEYLDLRWKKTTGSDFKVYFSGLYADDFIDGKDTRTQISKLFAEWSDLGAQYFLRFGRQPASGNTLFSRFDGLTLTYRPFNILNFSAGGGYPVETFVKNNLKIDRDRSFYETYLTLLDAFHLSGRIYYTEESTGGFSTRRATGVNGYWAKDNVNLTTIFDYDLDFKRANDELIGLEVGHSNIRYSGTVERRKNPFLDYGNGIFDAGLLSITPPITTLEELRQIKSRDEIRGLALANTADSLEYRFGAAVDFSSVWRGDFRYSYGVNEAIQLVNDATQMTHKRSSRYSMFFSERNGLNFSEIWTLLLLDQPGTDYQTTSTATTLSKYWNNGALVSLRVRWEHTEFKTSTNQYTRVIPGFAVSFQVKGDIQIGLDVDYTKERNSASPEPLKTIDGRFSVTIPF